MKTSVYDIKTFICSGVMKRKTVKELIKFLTQELKWLEERKEKYGKI